MITAISRVDTGQSRKVSMRGPVDWEAVASVAEWLAWLARDSSPASLWFPITDVLIIDVLAGNALY